MLGAFKCLIRSHQKLHGWKVGQPHCTAGEMEPQVSAQAKGRILNHNLYGSIPKPVGLSNKPHCLQEYSRENLSLWPMDFLSRIINLEFNIKSLLFLPKKKNLDACPFW